MLQFGLIVVNGPFVSYDSERPVAYLNPIFLVIGPKTPYSSCCIQGSLPTSLDVGPIERD